MLFTCLRISGARSDEAEVRERVITEAKRVLRLVDDGSPCVSIRWPCCDRKLQALPNFNLLTSKQLLDYRMVGRFRPSGS